MPLTIRLATALRDGRHLRTARVLCQADASPLTQKIGQGYARRAARCANVKPGIHILRHTFCSHVAMRGAPARAIQELHLSPATVESAIRLLDGTGVGVGRGNSVATGSTKTSKSSR